MKDFLQPIEQGSANIRVELKGGFIRVYHVETGEELHKRIARKGDWAELWKELSRADRNGTNVLSVIQRAKEDGKEIFSCFLFMGLLFALFQLTMLFIHIFN